MLILGSRTGSAMDTPLPQTLTPFCSVAQEPRTRAEGLLPLTRCMWFTTCTRKVAFPKLLQDPLVPEEDKRKIRDLLKKPWNPYIQKAHGSNRSIQSAQGSRFNRPVHGLVAQRQHQTEVPALLRRRRN